MFDQVQAASGLTFIDTNLPGFGASSTNHPRQATLAETHLFGTSAVNEFRFGFGQSKPGFPIQTPYPLGVRINFSDVSVAGLGVSSILPQGREQRTYQFTDNFSMIRGQHNLKFGGEYYYLAADSFFDSSIRPVITFATFADFANGTPASFSQNFGDSVRANRVKNFFAFVQDDWKVTRNLTLNLGLRMEYAGGPTEAKEVISNLNLDNRTAYGAAGTGRVWIDGDRQAVVRQQLQLGSALRVRVERRAAAEDSGARRIWRRVRFRVPEPDHQPAVPAAVHHRREACRARPTSPATTALHGS